MKRMAVFWQWLRRLSGDDAYERYLVHFQTVHAQDGGTPLSRRDYFKAEQERKWSGIKRCC